MATNEIKVLFPGGLKVDLPPGFPEKYRAPIVKAIDRCAVKAHILRPPQFEVVTGVPE